MFIWEVHNKGCMDAINGCTMVLVDALNPLKITNGHAHNMKITKKRSFM